VTERNCGNCRHFMRIENAATGHCTNPLVVSHQGQLVMYRAGEIGCRRGWKQDLWEAADEAGLPAAAAPVPGGDIPPDYSRAEAWADSAPPKSDPLHDYLGADALNDDDVLDPRRTRDIREAMRRAREMKKREQMTHTSREPFDQPILRTEQTPGEDSVLWVQPAPSDRDTTPIVPPVSADEVRRRVDEMRQPRNYNDPPPSIHFDQYDDHFGDRDDSPIIPELPQDSRLRVPSRPSAESATVSVESTYLTGDSDETPDDYSPYEPATELTVQGYDPTLDYDLDEETVWPEQAPWAEEHADDEWQQARPKKRSWFGNLLHRQPRQRPLDPRESAFTWEPDLEEIDHDGGAAPIAAEAPYEAAGTPAPFQERPVGEPAGVDRLPPLPYDAEQDARDDYLLADGRFSDGDEEDPAARQIEHVCATCRYFRPDGTCGNTFAFTYRRRVSEEYLSCSSSIGAWWLPSDYYWESVVSFTHHGQPTPLLDRYEIQSSRDDTDEEVRTP
jgi:hypothetical protein